MIRSFPPRVGRLLLLAVLCFLPSARANEPNDCDDCAHRRAGYPNAISSHARPSNTPHYTGCYVGGGQPFKGEPRYGNEGTWGWDYQGILPRRIWLGWSHGRRYQGGSGAYRSDGPHVAKKLERHLSHE